MRPAIRVFGGGLLLAIAIIGCGSTSSDGPAAGGGGVAITITRAFTFDPVELTVDRGASVTWTNTDMIAHTVTSGEAGSPTGKFDKQVEASNMFTFTFDEAGTYDFHCKIHRSMRGQVVVK